jgi:hypothetical protein
MEVSETPKLPEGCEPYLGRFGPVIYDAGCGKPIAWGFPIVRRVNDPEKWGAIARHGTLECIGALRPEWVLVTRYLSPAEAAVEYGEVTALDLGPRGGFRSVTYGATRFYSKLMDPRKKAA